MEDMPAVRFFSFAERLVAYKGAIRMKAEEDKSTSSSQHRDAPNRASRPAKADPAEVKTYRDIQHNPELSVYFERGVG